MLTVHRSCRGERLADALAGVLTLPAGDPFAAEVVAVPAKGVERWLTQRLSLVLGAGPAAADGVCANVTFPWPSTVLDEAVAAASAEHAASVSAWAPARARWSLVEVIDDARGETWCSALALHLSGAVTDVAAVVTTPGDAAQVGADPAAAAAPADPGRRLAVATRLAHAFEEYGQARPAMLCAWAEGADESGAGAPLDADLRWQPQLWRRLRERLGTRAPAELLGDACRRLRADPSLVALPDRLAVFGASRLSPARLQVLAALAEHRDVHLFVHHASPALWAAADTAPVPVRRAEDTVRRGLANPLLASLARDVLELQQALRRHAPATVSVLHDEPVTVAEAQLAAETRDLPELNPLLARLQQGLRDDTVPTDPPPLLPGDRTVQVHACHGRTRQVEVLREVVLGLLADDPTLEPRDILVMCPDVEAFAPLISAAFSLAPGGCGEPAGLAHPAEALRVRLADRSPRQTNALLEVLGQLLELGTARISAPQLLDLAARPAVRLRFDFDDDALERLREWVVGAGVRWGLDEAHRDGWQLGRIGQGTWRSGLDRLLLGAAVDGRAGNVHDVVPLDDVDSADIDLAGRLAEFVDRVDAVRALLSGVRTLPEWVRGLTEAVDALAATTAEGAWQQRQLQTELDELVTQAPATTVGFGLADLRAVLADVLAGRPTRASFRTGSLTVCTLVPMRSVPHRVICLLGLDDGTFPRQSTRDGDDVLARDPWTGERDPRSEDRQLLLDAINATQEHLVITYAGADPRTGAPIPPAVPLGEVLDAVDRAAKAPLEPGRRVRDLITTHHPLQPFDQRNFTPAVLGRPGPFSFDPAALQGSRAAAGERVAAPPFLPAALPAPPPGDVALAQLRALLRHPARGFLRQRLQVTLGRAEAEPGDALPVEFDQLQQWELGERLLGLRLSGLAPAQCVTLELARGLLPPGPLGEALLARVGRQVEALVTASAGEHEHPATNVDVDVALPDGTHLTGTVTGVHGQARVAVTYSRLGPRHALSAWVDLLALAAGRPGVPWRAVTAGRDTGRGGEGTGVAAAGGAARQVLGPLDPDAARHWLWELVQLYRSGLCAPLPLPLRTAAAYAQRRRRSRVPAALHAAQQQWASGRFPAEDADPEHVLLYGSGAALDVLTGQAPLPQEEGEGWSAEETDRFGRVARRVWDRLLAAESVQVT